MVSELVDTVTVSAELAVPGLMAPSMSALTASPACTTELEKRSKVSVVVALGLAKPTVWPVVVSVRVALCRLLRSVPEGKTMVTVLPAAPDRPPVAEVVNATV